MKNMRNINRITHQLNTNISSDEVAKEHNILYKLGIIEESLSDKAVLEKLKPYFYSQRIENVPEDEFPVWHTNEYHIDDDNIENICEWLKDFVLPTWYIHAFNRKVLYVVLQRKYFKISRHKNKSWDEMIEYGVTQAKVERHFLEHIPLHI